MVPKDLIEEIGQEDFDPEKFMRPALRDDRVRDEMVMQMAVHPDIMVYYHCYYVVSIASA